MVAFSRAMVAIGWAINAKAESLSMLYFGSVVAGVGGGAVTSLEVHSARGILKFLFRGVSQAGVASDKIGGYQQTGASLASIPPGSKSRQDPPTV
jgi:hypothetical protein